MSTATRSPAGRASSLLATVVLAASLPRPAAAFWYSRSCVQDPAGQYRCTGLSWSAGAGIGVSLLLLILGLIFLVAWINRPPVSYDIEEVWVAPQGVFAITPLPGQQVHVVQMQQAGGRGVYPWMPSTYGYVADRQQPQPQQQWGDDGLPLAPPPPPGDARDPYPSTIPESTPRSGVMRDVPLNSAKGGREDDERRMYEGMGGVAAQDVWRGQGTPRIVVSEVPEGRRAGLR